MPKKNNNHYFGENEEKAVVEFISSQCQIERSKIFNTKLKKPFEKMVESIINRYKLHRNNITYEEVFDDALSFLIQQAGMFKPEQNKKAYSYYGTICRNYLIGELKKDQNKIKKFNDFDLSVNKLEQELDYSYEIEDESLKANEIIRNLIEEVKIMLDNNETAKKKLTDNELKMGNAIIDIFSDLTLFFGDESSSPKFDKVAIISTLRAYTNLSTKDIRVALKKYKIIFKQIVNTMASE